MKRFYNIFILLLVLTGTTVQASSVLSSYGPGLYYRFPSARAMGMGGASIAVVDPTSVSRLNPAANTRLSVTTVMLQFFYEGNQYSDATSGANTGYANLDGFQFAVPLGNQMSANIGMQPLTRMDYHVSLDKSLDGFDYTKRVQGEGGLNTLDISFCWAPTHFFSFGLTGHYIFGRFKETWWVEYEDPAILKTRDVYSTNGSAVNFTLGFMFYPSERLAFGAVYTPKKEIVNKTTFTPVFEYETPKVDGYVTLPASLGFGAQYLAAKNFRLAADYEIQDWTEFEMSGRNPVDMANVQRISLGAEYKPSLDPLAAYFKKCTYRAGFATLPFYGKDRDGDIIRETWFTVGAGMPMFHGLSQVDISIGFGRRGDLSKNGIKEDLFRVGVSITGGERWFLRRY